MHGAALPPHPPGQLAPLSAHRGREERDCTNAVDVEVALAEAAASALDPVAFPFQFLTAFGDNDLTLQRLRKIGAGGSNHSDVPRAWIRRSRIGSATKSSRATGFCCPYPATDEAVRPIQSGSVIDYVYDPEQARLVKG